MFIWLLPDSKIVGGTKIASRITATTRTAFCVRVSWGMLKRLRRSPGAATVLIRPPASARRAAPWA
jgi:hypothetical protein